MPWWVVAAAFTGGSLLSANASRRSQKSASRAEQEIVKIQNKQSKREFLQSFRDAQAQTAISSIAALGGGYESSRAFASRQSLVTQRDLGIEEFDRQAALGHRAIDKRLDASRYGFVSNTFAQAASFAGSPAGQDIFGSGKEDPPSGPSPPKAGPTK